jgi:hypothetical protein
MDPVEEKSLTLVDDFVSEISHAQYSLVDKKPNGLVRKYQFWSCNHLHTAARGFALLRRSELVDASKFLIRPAIEMAFRLEAIRKHPDLFYRIAFSEHLREKQLLQVAAERGQTNSTIARSVEAKWKRFSEAFMAEFPNVPTVDKKLSIECTAEKAGMKSVYDDHYRIYSLYTHGALFANIGYLDDATDPRDNQAIAVCALIPLDTLISLGAESSNRDQLVRRLPKPQ